MSVHHTDRQIDCTAHAQPLFVLAFPTNYLPIFYPPSTQPCNQSFFFFPLFLNLRVWVCKNYKTRKLKCQFFISKSHNSWYLLLMYTLLKSKHRCRNARKINFLSSILQPDINPLLFLLGMLPIMLICQTLIDSISPFAIYASSTQLDISPSMVPFASALSSSDNVKPICQKLKLLVLWSEFFKALQISSVWKLLSLSYLGLQPKKKSKKSKKKARKKKEKVPSLQRK